jgi:hypothetical protein
VRGREVGEGGASSGSDREGESWYERLTALDAAFLNIEAPTAPMHVGSVSNVPGPQVPLYLLGRKLLACHPMVPLTTTTTISVALLSYDGSIDIGLLGDAEHAADLPELKRAIPIARAELSKGAGALKPSRGRGPRS